MRGGMEKNMAEVIYAKYNKLRRKEFRICTVICEENGERWVEKRPLCPEAKAHIARMAELGTRLKKVYPKIEFAGAEMTETGVRFEYLTGVTVDSLLARKMNSADALKDSFSEIFQWILPAETPVTLANIDCNLDNFLVENGRIVCLDYEWVFEHDVPIDFMRYRVIHYFYGTHPEAGRVIAESDLLAQFGIGSGECDAYEEMERKFQQYVFGEQANARYTDNYRQTMTEVDQLVKWQESEITELRKVVDHYRQVEGKLRKIGLWRILQAGQKIGRKIRQIIEK